MPTPVDFDSPDALKVVRGAFDLSDEHQQIRDDQCEDDYLNFHAVLDLTARDPDLAHVAIPKLYSIVYTKVPKEVRAAIGRQPYIPFDSERKDYSEHARLQSKMLNQLLVKSGFAEEFTLMDIIKICYGIGFMETRPYYEEDIQRVVKLRQIDTPLGPITTGYDVIPTKVLRLRLALTTYAQWELRFDPFARDLSTRDGCRFVIKIRIASRRELIKMAEAGQFGRDFDADRLRTQSFDNKIEEHRGLRILRKIGLPDPRPDSDIGVWFRYETPDRYIDTWNDTVTLRDIDNPYRKDTGGHGLINLSRCIHNVDPHTQARFWGNGEIKINECLSALLNDTVSLTMNNHNFLNIGMTKYAKNRGVSPDMLVNAVGNKIGFELLPGERISDLIVEDRGQSLPRDHYAMPQMWQDFMDLTANSQPVMRGEESTGSRTLGEISMLREAGDSLQEMNVKSIEDVFLRDFGAKCLCHIDQFAREEDKVELLGEEDANKLIFLNPRDLPGGFNFTFKGSDRVVNQAIKQHNMINLDKRISASPYLKEREWLTQMLEVHDMGDAADEVLRSEEEMAVLQQMQAEQAMQKAQAEQSQGRPESNQTGGVNQMMPTGAAQQQGNLMTEANQ